MRLCADHFAGITRQGYYKTMHGVRIDVNQAAALYSIAGKAHRLRPHPDCSCSCRSEGAEWCILFFDISINPFNPAPMDTTATFLIAIAQSGRAWSGQILEPNAPPPIPEHDAHLSLVFTSRNEWLRYVATYRGHGMAALRAATRYRLAHESNN